MTKLNMFLKFPRGSAGYGAIMSTSLANRLVAAGREGLVVMHRGDDLFQVHYVTRDNWKKLCGLAKKYVPEAKILQHI